MRRGAEVYGAAVAGLFAAVALWRRDLVLEAARVSLAVLHRGGPAAGRLVFEAALFGVILLVTWRVLSSSPVRPAHDAKVLALAAVLGWVVEAWGTRTGLWTYYTGEAPPPWIVPVWPLGAALVERLAAGRRPGTAAGYWLASGLALACAGSFLGARLAEPAVLLGLGAIALGLGVGARPAEELPVLLTGMASVFFADLWGTTNGCWAYFRHREPFGVGRGIAFGMVLDAVLVLVVLRLVRKVEKT